METTQPSTSPHVTRRLATSWPSQVGFSATALNNRQQGCSCVAWRVAQNSEVQELPKLSSSLASSSDTPSTSTRSGLERGTPLSAFTSSINSRVTSPDTLTITPGSHTTTSFDQFAKRVRHSELHFTVSSLRNEHDRSERFFLNLRCQSCCGESSGTGQLL